MSSMSGRQSSGSEGDPHAANNDERKRKRMLSNRESARRSRMRKQQHLDDLINELASLKNQNSQIKMKINQLTPHYSKLETDNAVLKAQRSELTERLRSLNSVLHIVEAVSGMAMDIPEIPDTLLKSWQLPCPSQPITAAADLLMF